MTVPQIPPTDNPYELAMHQANINYYEQNKFNPRIEAIEAAGTVIGVQFLVGFVVLLAAGFMVLR